MYKDIVWAPGHGTEHREETIADGLGQIMEHVSGSTDQAWLALGFFGQAIFAARFPVQWIASERHGESVIPPAFWWVLHIRRGDVVLLRAFAQRPLCLFSDRDWRVSSIYVGAGEPSPSTPHGDAANKQAAHCLSVLVQPLFPADATRYLSVAWEMSQFGQGGMGTPHDCTRAENAVLTVQTMTPVVARGLNRSSLI